MMRCKKHRAMTFAGLGALAYLVCHFWQYAIPDAVRPLHADLLQISVLGWTGMNLTSLLLGVVQWAVWGYLIATAFFMISKWCKRFCPEHEKGMSRNV